jgi:hypothetical protein
VTQSNSDSAGDFNPNFIEPDAYDSDDFNLKPIWERQPNFEKDSAKENGLAHWLRKD